MGPIILLDANVVGLLISNQPRPGNPDRRGPCWAWLRQRVATPGVLARVPAVADY